MFALLASLALAGSALAQDPSPLILSVSPGGAYSLASASWPAFSLLGAGVGLQLDGAWLSSADGSLVPAAPARSAPGSDSWGAYNATSIGWASRAAPSAVLMTTTFRAYAAAPAVGFEAAFPQGLSTGENGTAHKDGVVASFPTWTLPASSPLGFLQWAGPFINQGLKGPITGAFTAPGADISAGVAGGPLVLLDASAAASVVLSASSEFMAVSAAVLGGGAQLGFGPLGSAAALPAGYAYSTVAWQGAGVNGAVQAWGAALLAKHGKPHGLSKSDYTNTNLIYNTVRAGGARTPLRWTDLTDPLPAAPSLCAGPWRVLLLPDGEL